VALAVAAGARGYLHKDASRAELRATVTQALADPTWRLAPRRLRSAEMGAAPTLTAREIQVLEGMSHGRSNAEIGRELFLSEDTVKTHARRLFNRENNLSWIATIDLYQALVYHQDGRLAEAQELCERALAFFAPSPLFTKSVLCQLLLARIHLDQGRSGPAREICEFAEKTGHSCTIGSNLEMGVGSAAMIHLGIASRGIHAETFACDIIGPMYYEDDLLTEPIPIAGGIARCIEKPGLGVELDDAKVEKYRVS